MQNSISELRNAVTSPGEKVLTWYVRMLMIMWTIVIRVSVDNYSQTTEQIFAAEHRTPNHSLSCIPERKSIAKEIFAFAGDLKAD